MPPEAWSHHYYCHRLTQLAVQQAALRDWIAARQEHGWPVPPRIEMVLADLALARAIIVREVKTLDS